MLTREKKTNFFVQEKKMKKRILKRERERESEREKRRKNRKRHNPLCVRSKSLGTKNDLSYIDVVLI